MTSPELKDEKVTIKYDFTRPIEIAKFSEGLEGLSELYRIKVAGTDEAPKELRLYIKDIRKGSVEIDLIEMIKVAGGTLAPIASDIKVVTETVQRVKQVFDWLSGTSDTTPQPTKKEIEAASHFVAPIAENRGSSVQINVVNSPGTVIALNSSEANEIQNGATRALQAMKTPIRSVLKETPLVWVQTDTAGATKGRTGMRAVVEEASNSPLPVYFVEEESASLKSAMIADVEFPYRKTFIVDVETIVVQEKLRGYKVLRLHDILD